MAQLLRGRSGAITLGLVGYLFFVEFVSGVLQGYYIPLIPDLVEYLGIRDPDFNWFEAAQLLLSALVVPILAKLGDMIGHKNLQIRYPSDTPVFLEKVLLEAARAADASERFKRGPNPIMDDHVALNGAGIPSIDVIGDFSQFPWWHTSRDNLRLISRDSLEIILQVTWEMLNALLPD